MTGINFAKLPVKNAIKSKKSKSLNQNEKNSVSNDREGFNDIMSAAQSENLRTIDVKKCSISLKNVVSSAKKTHTDFNAKNNQNILKRRDISSKESQGWNKAQKVTKDDKLSNIDEKNVKSNIVDKNNSYEDDSSDSIDDNEILDEKITAALKKELGVDDDEIKNAMQVLGLSFVDLLKPENMILLTNELLKSDNSVDLLLSNNVKNLLNVINDLSKDDGQKNAVLNEVVEDNNSKVSFNMFLNDNKEENDAATALDNLKEKLNSPLEEMTDDKENNLTYLSKSDATVKEDKSDSDSKKTDVNVEIQKSTEGKESENGLFESLKDNKSGFNQKNGQEKQFDTSKKINIPFERNGYTNETFEVEPQVKNTDSYLSFNRIAEQIVKSAKVNLTDSVKSMEMMLHPENLGKIFMEVSEKDGIMKAKLVAENENVKNALEKQLVVLKEDFKEQGIKVDSVEISVGTHEFRENQEESAAKNNFSNQNNDQNQQGRNEGNDNHVRRLNNINMNNLDDLKSLMTEEEMLTAKIMRDQGNTLNFRA